MSSAINHKIRSHRSDHRGQAAFGNMSRRAYIRQSDSYSGKPYAARLSMFKRWLRERRESRRAAESEAQDG